MSAPLPLCPHPLVPANEDVDTTIWVGYSNCVVPCPSIVFTPAEWDRTVSVLQTLSFISCCLSGLVFLGHICKLSSRRYIRTMFIGGFCACSTVLTIFLFANMDESVTCNGTGHFVEDSNLCVLQAFALIITITWVICWSVIFSLDVYHHIVSLSPDYDSSPYHRRYTVIAVILSLTIAIIPFSAGNLGYDPEANIPICFYRGFSGPSGYFWYTFFTPMCMLIATCAAITIAALYQIQRIYKNSRMYDSALRHARQVPGSLLSKDVPYYDPPELGSTQIAIQNKSRISAVRTAGIQDDFDEEVSWNTSDGGSSASTVAVLTPSAVGRDSVSRSAVVHAGLVGQPVNDKDDDLSVDSSRYSMSEQSALLSGETEEGGRLFRGRSQLSVPSPSRDPPSNWMVWLWSRNTREKRYPTSISTTEGSRVLYQPHDLDSGSETALSVTASTLSSTWKRNARSIIFVSIFCVTGIFVASALYQIYHVRYDESLKATTEYIECLTFAADNCKVTTSQAAVDKCAEDLCGIHPSPRPSQPFLLCVLLWVGGMGIIPSLIYGFTGRSAAPGELGEEYEVIDDAASDNSDSTRRT